MSQNIQSKTCVTIALRGIVVFPGVTTTFEIARKASVKAMRRALENDSDIFLVTQRDTGVESPSLADVFPVGVLAKLKYTFRLPGGTWQIMAEGVRRAAVETWFHAWRWTTPFTKPIITP